MEMKFKSVCMLGVTGHGKSRTSNTICGNQNTFQFSSKAISETSDVKAFVTKWRGDSKEEPLIVIDTPGIGDSEGRDTKHIAKMVISLKQIGYVNTFLIVLNSEEPRFNEQLQQTLQLFIQMFGQDFFKNSMLCFTKYGYDRRSLRERKAGKKSRAEDLI